MIAPDVLIADNRQGVVLEPWGLDAGLKTPHRKTIVLRNVKTGTRICVAMMQL